MKIRVCLYKTQWKLKKKYLVSQLISIRTLSKYSHIEVWTPDAYYNSFEWEGKPCGMCWTSTMRDEDNGTVRRPAKEVLRHKDHWDFMEIEIDQHQHKALYWWMHEKVNANKGYSKWDILRFISPIHIADNSRDICSEFVNNALCVARVLDGFGIISPVAVAKKLFKKGFFYLTTNALTGVLHSKQLL